jgi:hypothetical protein
MANTFSKGFFKIFVSCNMSHFDNDVQEWLHDHFPGSLTGRCGVREWPLVAQT